MKKLIILIKIVIFIIVFYIIFIAPRTEAEIEAKHFIMLSTGYCPCKICCGKWANGETYTGDKAGRGCIAIDPKARILRMGQRLFIEGYGYGVANDIGGAIKGWEVDLCFDSHEEALEWGRKLVKVYLIEEDK